MEVTTEFLSQLTQSLTFDEAFVYLAAEVAHEQGTPLTIANLSKILGSRANSVIKKMKQKKLLPRGAVTIDDFRLAKSRGQTKAERRGVPGKAQALTFALGRLLKQVGKPIATQWYPINMRYAQAMFYQGTDIDKMLRFIELIDGNDTAREAYGHLMRSVYDVEKLMTKLGTKLSEGFETQHADIWRNECQGNSGTNSRL